MVILVASNNPKKLGELERILADAGIEGVELVDDPDEVVASVQFPDAEDLGDEEEDAEDESEEAAE